MPSEMKNMENNQEVKTETASIENARSVALICGNCKKFIQCNAGAGKMYTDVACTEYIKKRGRPSTMPARKNAMPSNEPAPTEQPAPVENVPAPVKAPIESVTGLYERSLIPTSNANIIWTRKFKEYMKDISALLDAGRSIILTSDAGNGKTLLIREYCASRKLPLVEVSCTGDMTASDLLGHWSIDSTGTTIWVDGLITDAVRTGKTLVLDEMNALDAEILFATHKLRNLESHKLSIPRKPEIVPAHPNFRLIGAMNPISYIGTKGLNAALLDGFDVVVLEYDPAVDREMLSKCSLLDEAGRDGILNIIQSFRNAFNKNDLSQPFGHRTLANILTLADIVGMDDAFNMGYFNKLTQEDKVACKAIKDMLIGALDANKKRIKDSKKPAGVVASV